MVLKPMWMLEGKVTKVKRVEGEDWIEDTYEDQNGDRAVIARPKTLYERVRLSK